MIDQVKEFGTWNRAIGAPGFPDYPLWWMNELAIDNVIYEKDLVNNVREIKGLKDNDTIKLKIERISDSEGYASFVKNGTEQGRFTEKIKSNPAEISFFIHSDQDTGADLAIKAAYNEVQNQFDMTVNFNQKNFQGTLKGGENEIPKFVLDAMSEIESYQSKIAIDFNYELLYPLIGETYSDSKPLCDVSRNEKIGCGIATLCVDALAFILSRNLEAALVSTLVALMVNMAIITLM